LPLVLSAIGLLTDAIEIAKLAGNPLRDIAAVMLGLSQRDGEQ